MSLEFMHANPTNGIIYISAYNLGKERIIFALADALPQYPIFLDGKKMLIMEQLLGAGQGRERVGAGQFTSDPYLSSIHVTQMGFVGTVFPYFKPNFSSIQDHMLTLNAFNQSQETTPAVVFTKALAFLPTGWADSDPLVSDRSRDEVSVQLVPYSEHSQCEELMQFVRFLRPREVVPTVYSDEKARLSILDLFRHAVDRAANMRLFIGKMGSPASKTANDDKHASMSASTDASSARVTGTKREESVMSDVHSGREVIELMECEDDEDEEVKEVVHNCDSDFKSRSGDHGDTAGLVGERKRKVESCAPFQSIESNTTNFNSRSSKRTAVTTAADMENREWICVVCTYSHRSAESAQYLTCEMCGSVRG
eukprot:gene24834-31222_t